MTRRSLFRTIAAAAGGFLGGGAVEGVDEDAAALARKLIDGPGWQVLLDIVEGRPLTV